MRQIGVNDLNEIEIACLMRVLSKPELDHAIVLPELLMVMNNFGLEEENDDEKPTQEDITRKKQKKNKKKLMKQMINMEKSEVY